VSTAATQHPRIRIEKATKHLNLRIAPTAKKMLETAAKIRKYNLTDFILKASQDAAEDAIAEQTRFVLPEKQWAAFNAALDAPPKAIPVLKRLFEKQTVFER
jgi:uncharacterized protein (DUF1778 family)